MPQALGSVANLPSILARDIYVLATSSALLHLISTCKRWLFILIRDWGRTTAAIHDQKVLCLNQNLCQSAANAFLPTKTNEILSKINSKREKRQRMCATYARHALSRYIEQCMTSITALLQNALIRKVEAMNRSQNALLVYSKDIESLFGREKRTHTCAVMAVRLVSKIKVLRRLL